MIDNKYYRKMNIQHLSNDILYPIFANNIQIIKTNKYFYNLLVSKLYEISNDKLQHCNKFILYNMKNLKKNKS